MFKDITPLLKEGPLFREVIQHLAQRYRDAKPDVIVSVESRGFFLGAPLAFELGVGIVPVRKKGKLPRKTKSVSYELEYGLDHLEIHEGDLKKAHRVLIVDDVLATGGTISAVVKLVEDSGAQVMGIDFLIELLFLKGREKLKKYEVFSMVQY